jgi:GMP synthase-like glutamine amidotransferase
MKFVSVIQHNQSEWLGHLEDHLEGRGVRFSYSRPFATGGGIPKFETVGDGLILLGGGPWGSATPDRLLPTLDAEVRLVRACLMHERPVVGIGLGAQILSLAADGKVVQAPLIFEVGEATRALDGALGGLLPARFPYAVYMRDKPVPPDYATILARDGHGDVALFQIGKNAFGFAAHPGLRRAMIEDLIMESDDHPVESGPPLELLSKLIGPIEDALVPIMSGLVAATGWLSLPS